MEWMDSKSVSLAVTELHQCPTYGSGLGLALFFRPSLSRDFFGPASRESRASAHVTKQYFQRCKKLYHGILRTRSRTFQAKKAAIPPYCHNFLVKEIVNCSHKIDSYNNDACKSLAHKKVEYNYQNKFFTATATISVIMALPSCLVCLKVSLSQLCGCAKFPAGWPKKVSRQAWPEERHET